MGAAQWICYGTLITFKRGGGGAGFWRGRTGPLPLGFLLSVSGGRKSGKDAGLMVKKPSLSILSPGELQTVEASQNQQEARELDLERSRNQASF